MRDDEFRNHLTMSISRFRRITFFFDSFWPSWLSIKTLKCTLHVVKRHNFRTLNDALSVHLRLRLQRLIKYFPRFCLARKSNILWIDVTVCLALVGSSTSWNSWATWGRVNRRWADFIWFHCFHNWSRFVREEKPSLGNNLLELITCQCARFDTSIAFGSVERIGSSSIKQKARALCIENGFFPRFESLEFPARKKKRIISPTTMSAARWEM